MMAAKKANDLAPPRIRREFFRRIEAPYKLTGVNAGEVEAVHERTMTNLHRQQLVEVNGQADVLILGVPYLGPYNVNSILNPILVHCLGLGYLFNMYRNKPLVREGGVVILHHPVPWEFNQIHHPSYIDFFEEVLRETTDPKKIEATFEERYATDPWYRAPVPDQSRLPRRAPVLHVVLGRARSRPRRRRDLRRREPLERGAARVPARGLDARRDRDGEGHRGLVADDDLLPCAARDDRGRAVGD